MSLVELLVVISIIALLAAIAVPNLGRIRITARAATNMANLRDITVATIAWSADNGGRLPSPVYPGGMKPPPNVAPEDFFPKYWDLGDSGLWLDGVVFGMFHEEQDENEEYFLPSHFVVNDRGDHLRGTFFESTQAAALNPAEEDWHRHSYAMNANLRYDRIYDTIDSDDPYLTEKTMSNFLQPTAMIFTECNEKNVIMASDRSDVVDTIKERWAGTKVIATFLDGHAERLSEHEIPSGPVESDREASRFWRGVDPRR